MADVNDGGGFGLGSWGTLIGGLGQAYGAIEQSKNAKDLLNLQKQGYYDELKRRNQAQLSLESAVDGSSLFAPKKPVAAFPLGSV